LRVVLFAFIAHELLLTYRWHSELMSLSSFWGPPQSLKRLPK
jgi:hypothetical protein